MKLGVHTGKTKANKELQFSTPVHFSKGFKILKLRLNMLKNYRLRMRPIIIYYPTMEGLCFRNVHFCFSA